MELKEAMEKRHAVRSYTDRKLAADVIEALNQEIAACNQESGLHIQLVTDEPEAFGGFMAHYGKFVNVKNYIALVGKKGPTLDEAIGYYGERVALNAQQLGLNTCWVAMTYSKGKSKVRIGADEKLVCVLALGYGENQGVPHKSKPMEALCTVEGTMPDWFRSGMEAAMLAPTATNQQKFRITQSGGTVAIKAGAGFYVKVDLGIVKYHFEVGAGSENVTWRV